MTRTTTAPADRPQPAALIPATVETLPRALRVDDHWTATYLVTGYPDTLPAAWLETLLSFPGRLDLSLHIDPLQPEDAAALLRRQRARLESADRKSVV